MERYEKVKRWLINLYQQKSSIAIVQRQRSAETLATLQQCATPL